jgi:hypothetical protein
MIIVAVVAIVLATESFIWRLSVNLVIEVHDAEHWEYIQSEAVMAWVILNAILSIAIGVVAVTLRAVHRWCRQGVR